MPVDVWDDLTSVGLRSHFVTSQHAVPIMLRQARGLIVNISSAGAATKIGIVPYGVAKAALDHMTGEMASELQGTGVVVVSLWPPPTRTENHLAVADADTNTAAWSSPEFTGRVIAALANDPELSERSGQVLRVRELARKLGVPDDSTLWPKREAWVRHHCGAYSGLLEPAVASYGGLPEPMLARSGRLPASDIVRLRSRAISRAI